ncbi:MAG: hypothetical protein GX558_10745, partial [Clostridiales bacterium]|nr:hypothetical protein [Clostridiales bacterium]
MTEYERELAEERVYLARVVDVARRQLDQAERDGAAGRAALTQSAGEMREQAEQMFLDLWSADSFEALANLNQLAQPIAVSRRTGRMRDDRAGALRAMLDAPYFARIDVRFDDGGDEERVYIGRAT